MDNPNKELQSQMDKALAARTIRIERANNGFIVKRADGHFIYCNLKEAFDSVDLYFKSQTNGREVPK